MGTVTDALSWSGSGATLSLFVVADRQPAPPLELSWREFQPTQVRTYNLDDTAALLGERYVFEYDATFGALPAPLSGYLDACLREAMHHGAEVAWFGFEGSFDFAYLLAPQIAPQIYGLADSQGVELALEDDVLMSEAWRTRVAEARIRILHHR